MDKLNFKSYQDKMENMKNQIMVIIIYYSKINEDTKGINKPVEFLIKFFFDIFLIFVCYIFSTLWGGY